MFWRKWDLVEIERLGRHLLGVRMRKDGGWTAQVKAQRQNST